MVACITHSFLTCPHRARLYQGIADDQLQLALVLSASLGEEEEVWGTGPGEIAAVRETKSKARGRKRPKL